MYLLTNNFDFTVVGSAFYQVEKLDMNIPNYHQLCSDLGYKKLSFVPQLRFFAAYKAKLTDFLSGATQYLLVTEKILKILLDFNIDNYQYFEADIVYRKKHYTYYLFYIYGDNYEWINYKNMTFLGESNRPYGDFYRKPHEQFNTQKKEIKVEKPEQLINWQKLYPDYPNQDYECLKLNHSNINQDIIRTPSLLGNHYLVSERLRNKLIEVGCTGMLFRTEDSRGRSIL